MLVASLDTSTLTLSCALVDVSPGARPHLRCERTEHAPAKAPRAGRASRRPQADGAPAGGPPSGHSARLPRALADLLTAEGLAIPDIEGYAIGLGPGSFTGLRIGLATWKGFAYANRRPIAGCSSLAAMALAAAADAGDGTLLVPLLDAKKGEVYAGFYRARAGGIVEVEADAALPPGAVAGRVAAILPAGATAAGFGEGYDAYAEAVSPSLPRLRTEVRTPPALAVASLVAERLALGSYDAQGLFALEPHYVRPSEAELKFPQGLVPGAPWKK